ELWDLLLRVVLRGIEPPQLRGLLERCDKLARFDGGAPLAGIEMYAYLHLADNLASGAGSFLLGHDGHETLVSRQLGLGPWNRLLEALAAGVASGASTEPDPVAGVISFARQAVPNA